MADFIDEEDIQKGSPFFLGVLGARIDATPQILQEQILNPILSEIGRVPEKLVLPEEGISSIYLADWADSLRVPNQIYEADWHRHQRRAKIFRDARIQSEATHFLLFLNKRSTFNEKVAIRLARQGRTVFTIPYGSWELEQLTLNEEIPPSSKSPSARQAKRGCKPGKERGNKSLLTMLQQEQSQ